VRLAFHLRQLAAEPPTEVAELVAEAERLGYHSVWSSESYGMDAATVLGWLAARTSTIRIGSAIFQIPARSAAMTAMTVATLDRLSGGRVMLGLGSSGPQVSEGWHGVSFAGQLQRTREYVALVRRILDREPSRFEGETIVLPLPAGPGKPLRLAVEPSQIRIPVYLAAIGPKNIALAGEIADGWLPTLLAPELITELREQLDEGAGRGGRTLDAFDIAPHTYVSIGEDEAARRDLVRPLAALYVGGMGSREQNFYNRLMIRSGYESAARRVQELFLAGRREEAAAALPVEYLDRIALTGPPGKVRERLEIYAAVGVGTLGVTPLARDHQGRLEQLQLLAAVASDMIEDAPTEHNSPGVSAGLEAGRRGHELV
jgi:F420-dependent oxidoreductase-like protein